MTVCASIHSRLLRAVVAPSVVTAMLCCVGALTPHALHAQRWTPAGQMIGPLMWEFPLSLPDGTHLIPLRGVSKRSNDSLYWFDIKSFATTPKMYEKQTLDFKQISDVNDFDSDGRLDLWGGTYAKGGLTIFGVFTEEERRRPHQTGMVYASSEVNTRYFGDLDGDGLNDDLAAQGEYAARVVFGDRDNPFIGPSYVELFDNSHVLHPELPPTKVIAVGMLSGKPCIIQAYQLLPETAPFYELHELNMDDLRARAPKIRTRRVQKINVGENRFYGNVVLRTANVWWLYSSYGADTSPNGIKITQTSMSLEPVSSFWIGGFQQYFGQGGKAGDGNFPRVMEGNRPFIREDFTVSEVEGVGAVRHAVYTVARLVDPDSATVEIIGVAYPVESQYSEAFAVCLVMVPDIDNDSIDDFMVGLSYWDVVTKQYKNSVSLYLTSQRPTVSVKETAEDSRIDTTMLVVDQGESWRVIDGGRCFSDPSVTAQIYDVNGAMVLLAPYNMSGSDVIIDKPRNVSRQALWLRVGVCTVRLP